MVRYCIAFIVWFVAIAIGPALAQGKRVALVIGNGGYQHVPRLLNTLNDADDVAGALSRLGFEVSRVKDGRFDDMRRAFRDFGRRTTGADMAVLFFAGHGMEIGGENWLIPVDAELQRDTDAEAEALSLKSAMLQVASARHLGLVILDACRNNPFAARMTRTIRTRSVDRGLARSEPSDNVLVAYAAKEGTTAADGTGRNSPFTSALLAHIETPGLEINFLFRAVRDDVLSATRNEQQPFVYGSLSREAVYLKAAAAAAPPLALHTESALKASEVEIARRVEAERKRLADELVLLEEERKRLAAATPSPSKEPARRDPAQSVAPGSGRSFRDRFLDGRECQHCPEMVVVPRGSFKMGSPEKERGSRVDERPQRIVTINRSLVVGKFEVTFAEWDACHADGGCGHKPDDKGWGRGRQPVIDVSWDDSKEYAAWLAKKTGKAYRLLTEAEWEYAARAETTTAFAFGNTITGKHARYLSDSPVEVGRYPANRWGLHDMHGNVFEWVEDCYVAYYNGALSDGSARLAGNCPTRVVRSGSWRDIDEYLRSASRHDLGPVQRERRAPPVSRYDIVGFRVARPL